MRWQLQNGIDAQKFRRHLIPVSQMGGVQSANETAEVIRFASVKDYRDWLARMASASRTVTLWPTRSASCGERLAVTTSSPTAAMAIGEADWAAAWVERPHRTAAVVANRIVFIGYPPDV